ncbi:hypothetical protein SNOG_07403 [Parastagonospora nodorum SN15]|uniref:Uncharacterized protein n=1 Tax=Phaeosphaeria nodorum (strain SN15 / ATCC MYA-4574 / FGSC 10173) TaxID=321614 RepID=Q0ULG1_PHANO|nr:hypothetical protein SNOG_07403 [Parastagonospora nodorum SN15]EAT84869.1 hypothetical protein SNOG_07403 [Parastagonospora nodorum SN15]
MAGARGIFGEEHDADGIEVVDSIEASTLLQWGSTEHHTEDQTLAECSNWSTGVPQCPSLADGHVAQIQQL